MNPIDIYSKWVIKPLESLNKPQKILFGIVDIVVEEWLSLILKLLEITKKDLTKEIKFSVNPPLLKMENQLSE
jgi:hypothetical protein